MRILFLDAYFEPEQIAFTHLEKDLIEGLIQAGHEIEVVCPVPTRGVSKEISIDYRKRKKEVLYNGHVHVTRFYAPQEGKNPLIRAFRYFWCNLRTYQIGKSIKDIDVVFCNSTPPTQGLIAGKVAKKRNVPFVYSLQDIFPDSLVTTGLTKKGSLLWKIGRIIETKTYKGCERILVISNTMKDNLLNKGVKPSKVEVITNWINTDLVRPVCRKDNSLFDEFGIDREKFIVLYAGNFGAAQGSIIVLDAAEKLIDEKNIQFVIFGGGAEFDEAVDRASDMSNVIINPLLPQSRISEVYSLGDIAIITCKKGVGNSGMPSKTWSIMACNTPIIACFDKESELSDLFALTNAGICIEPENTDYLVNRIKSFVNRDYSTNCNGRQYVVDNCSHVKCVKKYINEMRRACEDFDDQ